MASVAGDFVITSISGDTSTDGVGVSIVATTSPGTTLHTATSGTDYWDYVKVWLVNTDTVTRTVYVQWGGTAAKDAIPIDVAPGIGPVAVFEDFRPLRNGLLIRAYCATTAVVTAHGEVHTYRQDL